jgi:hypothetical protein
MLDLFSLVFAPATATTATTATTAGICLLQPPNFFAQMCELFVNHFIVTSTALLYHR